MTVACLMLKLTPSEALAACTVNAAAALGLAGEVGSLETGRTADFVVWNVPTHRQIPYWPGASLVQMVVKRGRVVFERTGG
jgi:imidazolonepropionase